MKKILKFVTGPLAVVFILLFSNNISAQHKNEASPNVDLQLAPSAERYTLEEGVKGKLRYKNRSVSFRAIISNHTDSTITIAHPGTCQPDSVEYPLTFKKALELREGQSEILIYITKPNGNTIKLRERIYPYFEWVEENQPGNISYLIIPPYSSKYFHVGWFFINPRGRWVEDDLASQVFLERGTFHVQLCYRNMFTNCQVPDHNTLWTGTLLSNEITINIR